MGRKEVPMVKPKPFPNEMQRLRDMLDERGIEWHDKSDEPYDWWERSDYGSAGYDRIWRTHFDVGGNRLSVICGYGTYGREFDLLECMRLGLNEEPYGNLTADDVMRLVDGELAR